MTGGLAEFRRILRSDFDPEDLFAVLADDEPAAEVGPGESRLERARSARFIRGEVYGTRSSTVLLVERDGAVVFEERSFDPRALETGRVAFERRAEVGADITAVRTPSRFRFRIPTDRTDRTADCGLTGAGTGTGGRTAAVVFRGPIR